MIKSFNTFENNQSFIYDNNKILYINYFIYNIYSMVINNIYDNDNIEILLSNLNLINISFNLI